MKKKVLVISKVYTHPTDMGNSWGILAQTKALQELGCGVDFLFVQERGLNKNNQDKYNKQYNQTKKYWGNHFLYFSVGRFEKFCKNLLSLFRIHICEGHEGTYDKYPLKLTRFVEKLQEKNKYDICIVNYYYLTKLFRSVKFDKMACFTHDALSYRYLVVNEKCSWIDAHQEASALQLCTDVFAVQDAEREYFQILSPKSRLFTIYSKYPYSSTPVVNNHNIVFLSGNNGFNQNGLKWFVKEVYPLIKSKFPDSKLIIGGGICKVVQRQYDSIEGVELIGYVDSPLDLYKLGDVAINPVYQGTGLKIKTFEAISYGKVTLVHPHSMAGVYDKEKAPLFASANPESWVEYLTKIWNNVEEIARIKEQDKEFLSRMDNFVISEYKRFINL